MEDLTKSFEKIPSITPWDEIEVGETYLTPQVLDVPRMTIQVLSKEPLQAECNVRTGNVLEKVTIHKTSIAAKFIIKEKEF